MDDKKEEVVTYSEYCIECKCVFSGTDRSSVQMMFNTHECVTSKTRIVEDCPNCGHIRPMVAKCGRCERPVCKNCFDSVNKLCADCLTLVGVLAHSGETVNLVLNAGRYS